MKARVLLIATWFRLPPRRVLPLLSEWEIEALAIEAMLSRTVIVHARNYRIN